MKTASNSNHKMISLGILRFLPVIVLLMSVLLLSGGFAVTQAIERAGIIDLRPDVEVAPELEEDARRQRPLLWRNYLLGYFEHVDMLSADFVEEQGLAAYDLLVLPESRQVARGHAEAILEFLSRGGALILTGQSGVRLADIDSGPTMAESLGLNYRTDPIPGAEESTSWWVIKDRPAYLTSRVPVLQHLAVEQSHPAMVSGNGQSLAFWMSAATETEETFDDAAPRSALSAGSYGDGRFLWLGFSIDGVGGDLETSQNFHQLLTNTFDWFQGRATVEIEPWPYPYQRAAAFSMDTETAFGNVRGVAGVDNLEVLTYFLLTEPADLYVDLLQRIARGSEAEIGTGEMAVHGDDHDVFRGLPREVQTSRLQSTVDYIQEHIGERPLGFRPPEEAYDYTTLQSLAETGFKYIFADDNPTHNTPAIVSVGNHRLVQFPMLNKDDIDIIIREDDSDPEKVLDAYIKDIDQIFRREGVYLANFHTHVLASSEYIDVLRSVVDYARAGDPWFVSYLDLARWWLRRDAVELTVIDSQPGKLRFIVVNDGDENVNDLGFSLWLPEGGVQARLQKQPQGERILDYRRDGDRRLRFSLSELRPNDQQEYLLRW